ncbi:MAG: hydantoinase/oxoprolinase family protein, partial [Chloroflexota bacterium]|nr:hydantoinase/oxoprolinase family protein [Chloroflexota bacterium]
MQTIIGVDIGGTFTDFVLVRGQEVRVHKVPSTPRDPSLALVQGLQEMGVRPGEAGVLVVHGSTVATNALLERKGALTAFITTAGFEDLLEIGRQNRPSLYDLNQERPMPLVPRHLRFGVPERLDFRGNPLLALTPQQARALAERVKATGAEAVAVSLLFSFLNPAHEMLLKDALQQVAPNLFLSVSCEVFPEYREYERGSTVTVNSYVGPKMAGYLRRLGEVLGRRLRIMQSNGGSMGAEAAATLPVRTILSGPAGGVVGAFTVASQAGFPQVITLDMGGTSTDVSLCPGRIQETTSSVISGVPIGLPMIDIHTVGAGGGSIARLDAGGALRVGPDSVGADPGPACYGKGDQVAVTDANLFLGRLDPRWFLGGRMALDVERSRWALGRLAKEMGTDLLGAASGVVRVVNANMERAVRAISLERGFDPRQFTLLPFGGAGPQHACELAQELRIPRVFVPLFPGALSAYGCAIADVVKDFSRTFLRRLDSLSVEELGRQFAAMEERGRLDLLDEGVAEERIMFQRFLDVRYVGQSYELTVPCPPLDSALTAEAARRFHQAHDQRFGYSDPRAPVEVVNIRLKAIGVSDKPQWEARSAGETPAPSDAILDRLPVAFGGQWVETPIYVRERLQPGHTFPGPAVVVQMDATTVVPPGWRVRVDGYGNLVV